MNFEGLECAQFGAANRIYIACVIIDDIWDCYHLQRWRAHPRLLLLIPLVHVKHDH